MTMKNAIKKMLRSVKGAAASGLLFQGTFVSLTQNDNLGTSLTGVFKSGNGLADFFQGAFTTALVIGAMLAVLRLAYAGWLYMGAADMWGSKQKAKDVIFNAVLGLLLLISIWIVLNQINPTLLNLNITQTVQANPVQSSAGGVPCTAGGGCVQN